ncbi:MAG TPA: FAD-dependent oxidoreductase [Candidatus Saccharimonadales bacterium]|nr:FAD-dependent oxidoreductase [Candidatus Saccharimonadales bacterium]
MKLRLKEQLSEFAGTKTFVFEPEEPVTWQAGQYLHYFLEHPNADERGTERWFTIASAPYEKAVKITTRISPDHTSSFKTALQALKPGDEINSEEPKGKFVLDDPSRDGIFVSGGIGITPYIAILRQLDHDGSQINIELLYANRDDKDIPFRAELEAIAARHPNFHITYFIGEHKIDRQVLEEFGKKLEDPVYYISGPEPMVEAFEKTLKEMGLDEEHYKLDFFPGYPAE